MKSGLHYKLEWITVINEQIVTVLIKDQSVQIEDDEDPEVIVLQPSGQPLVIKNINHEQDKYSNPIRAKQAVIQFLSTPNYGITTFSGGTDRQYKVEVTTTVGIDTSIIFHGFLSLADLSQPFLPNPQVVTIYATDNLGLLKDIPLTDTDENPIRGMNKIGYYLANALLKTGLSLDINVQNNLRHGTGEYTAEVDFTSNAVNLPSETSFFYPGQRVRISGTASNNGDYQVRGDIGFLFLDLVTFEETFTTESNVTATLLDISSDFHLYDTIYLDAKTFEKEIGESEDCYTVIQKILGDDSVLFQYQGRWVIQRIDEQDGNQFFFGIFNPDGTFSTFDTTQSYLMDIGAGEDVYWIDADCLLMPERRLGNAKDVFNYNTPKEIISNIDFDRGDVIDDSDPNNITYEVKDWDFKRHIPMGGASSDPVGEAYILKEYNDNAYETERYVVIEEGPGVHDQEALKSEGLPVDLKDKLEISIDFRLDTDIGNTSNLISALSIELVGDDGNFYYVSNNDFFQYNISIPELIYNTYDPTDQDTTEWMTLLIETGPAPVSGTLYIYLGQSAPGSATRTEYQNLNVDYYPLINGSYRKYNGQYNKIKTESTDLSSKRENDIYISDSPKKLFKGSLLIPSVGTELHNGSIQFGSPDGFALSGDQTSLYRPNTYIYIDSPSHSGIAKVVSSTFNIIGGTTAVTVSGLIISTVTETGTIKTARFNLANHFFTSHAFGQSYPPTPDHSKQYSRQQIDAIWNQYRNPVRKFSGNLYGLPALWPDLIHKYSLTDTNPNTIDRYFILLDLEQDWKSEKWRGTFIEVYNTITGKVYTDPFEFKYISE